MRKTIYGTHLLGIEPMTLSVSSAEGRVSANFVKEGSDTLALRIDATAEALG